MKKLSKKKWKEYFEEPSNWKVCTRLSHYGMQITRLAGTEVFALERWFGTRAYQAYPIDGHWTQVDYFTLREDDEMKIEQNSITKTSALERLYRCQYVLTEEECQGDGLPW